jgi:hypothetical protein
MRRLSAAGKARQAILASALKKQFAAKKFCEKVSKPQSAKTQ